MLRAAALSYGGGKRIRIDNSTPTAKANETNDTNDANDAQADDSSPPALGFSRTFESTDSSEMSSVDCVSLCRAAYAHAPFVENEPAVAARHDHEYYSAIHAASERLRLAKMVEANSRKQLQRALGDHERSKQVVQSASAFLDGVEERWGVIDLEVSADESDRGVDGGRDGPPVTSIVTIPAHQDRVTDVELIQVSQAGENMVNGTYRLVRGVGVGPAVYVHAEGPVEILDAQYDVCIFMKTGYGDRIRWCVALVPFTSLAKSDKGRVEVGEEDERRELELAQAYIYYWIELYATERNCASPPTGADSKKWGVCHGDRPLPVLKDVTNRRRWWQFWR